MKGNPQLTPSLISLLLIAISSSLSLGDARAQDATAGKVVYAQCIACHSVDGKNGAGPSLKGIVGRAAGASAGFGFSRAMRGVNMQWTAESLDAFIANPKAVVPNNAMPFSGLSDAKQRADLLAYLQTLN